MQTHSENKMNDIKQNQAKETVASIMKLLECAICLDVLDDPVSTGCYHYFCRGCIATVLKSKYQAPCPLCKKSFIKRSLQDKPQLKAIIIAAKKLAEAFKQDTGLEVTPPRGPKSSVLSPESRNLQLQLFKLDHPSPLKPSYKRRHLSENALDKPKSRKRFSKKRKNSYPIYNDQAADEEPVSVTTARTNVNIQNKFPPPLKKEKNISTKESENVKSSRLCNVSEKCRKRQKCQSVDSDNKSVFDIQVEKNGSNIDKDENCNANPFLSSLNVQSSSVQNPCEKGGKLKTQKKIIYSAGKENREFLSDSRQGNSTAWRDLKKKNSHLKDYSRKNVSCKENDESSSSDVETVAKIEEWLRNCEAQKNTSKANRLLAQNNDNFSNKCIDLPVTVAPNINQSSGENNFDLVNASIKLTPRDSNENESFAYSINTENLIESKRKHSSSSVVDTEDNFENINNCKQIKDEHHIFKTKYSDKNILEDAKLKDEPKSEDPYVFVSSQKTPKKVKSKKRGKYRKSVSKVMVNKSKASQCRPNAENNRNETNHDEMSTDFKFKRKDNRRSRIVTIVPHTQNANLLNQEKDLPSSENSNLKEHANANDADDIFLFLTPVFDSEHFKGKNNSSKEISDKSRVRKARISIARNSGKNKRKCTLDSSTEDQHDIPSTQDQITALAAKIGEAESFQLSVKKKNFKCKMSDDKLPFIVKVDNKASLQAEEDNPSSNTKDAIEDKALQVYLKNADSSDERKELLNSNTEDYILHKNSSHCQESFAVIVEEQELGILLPDNSLHEGKNACALESSRKGETFPKSTLFLDNKIDYNTNVSSEAEKLKKDYVNLSVTKVCCMEKNSSETLISVSQVTSPEDQGKLETVQTFKSPGWSHQKQMAKDFHPKTFPVLKIHKSKAIGNPVSISVEESQKKEPVCVVHDDAKLPKEAAIEVSSCEQINDFVPDSKNETQNDTGDTPDIINKIVLHEECSFKNKDNTGQCVTNSTPDIKQTNCSEQEICTNGSFPFSGVPGTPKNSKTALKKLNWCELKNIDLSEEICEKMPHNNGVHVLGEVIENQGNVIENETEQSRADFILEANIENVINSVTLGQHASLSSLTTEIRNKVDSEVDNYAQLIREKHNDCSFEKDIEDNNPINMDDQDSAEQLSLKDMEKYFKKPTRKTFALDIESQELEKLTNDKDQNTLDMFTEIYSAIDANAHLSKIDERNPRKSLIDEKTLESIELHECNTANNICEQDKICLNVENHKESKSLKTYNKNNGISFSKINSEQIANTHANPKHCIQNLDDKSNNFIKGSNALENTKLQSNSAIEKYVQVCDISDMSRKTCNLMFLEETSPFGKLSEEKEKWDMAESSILEKHPNSHKCLAVELNDKPNYCNGQVVIENCQGRNDLLIGESSQNVFSINGASKGNNSLIQNCANITENLANVENETKIVINKEYAQETSILLTKQNKVQTEIGFCDQINIGEETKADDFMHVVSNKELHNEQNIELNQVPKEKLIKTYEFCTTALETKHCPLVIPNDPVAKLNAHDISAVKCSNQLIKAKSDSICDSDKMYETSCNYDQNVTELNMHRKIDSENSMKQAKKVKSNHRAISERPKISEAEKEIDFNNGNTGKYSELLYEENDHILKSTETENSKEIALQTSQKTYHHTIVKMDSKIKSVEKSDEKCHNHVNENYSECNEKTKVTKRVCLTMDEIQTHFENSYKSGLAEIICTLPSTSNDFKIQLSVSDQTLNVSILKIIKDTSQARSISTMTEKQELLQLCNKSVQTVEYQNCTKKTEHIESIYQPLKDISFEVQQKILDDCIPIPKITDQNKNRSQIYTDINDSSQSLLPAVCEQLSFQDNHDKISSKNLFCTVEENKNTSDCKGMVESEIEHFQSEDLDINVTSNKNRSSCDERRKHFVNIENLGEFNALNERESNICNKFQYSDIASCCKADAPKGNPKVNSAQLNTIEQKETMQENAYDTVLKSPLFNNQLDMNSNQHHRENFNNSNMFEVCSVKDAEVLIDTESHINADKAISENVINKDHILNANTTINDNKKSSRKNDFVKTGLVIRSQTKTSPKNIKAIDKPNDIIVEMEFSGSSAKEEEGYTSEEIDPFMYGKGHCNHSPSKDEFNDTQPKFEDMIIDSDSFSSDPDMVFAKSLVAPLKDMAEKFEKTASHSEINIAQCGGQVVHIGPVKKSSESVMENCLNANSEFKKHQKKKRKALNKKYNKSGQEKELVRLTQPTVDSFRASTLKMNSPIISKNSNSPVLMLSNSQHKYRRIRKLEDSSDESDDCCTEPDKESYKEKVQRNADHMSENQIPLIILSDTDVENGEQKMLDSPQALAKVIANVEADLQCVEPDSQTASDPVPFQNFEKSCGSHANVNDVTSSSAWSSEDLHPSQVHGQIQMEIEEMKERIKIMEAQILKAEQEGDLDISSYINANCDVPNRNENIVKIVQTGNNIGTQDNELNHVKRSENNAQSGSSDESDDLFTPPISPTPPRQVSKYNSKEGNSNCASSFYKWF